MDAWCGKVRNDDGSAFLCYMAFHFYMFVVHGSAFLIRRIQINVDLLLLCNIIASSCGCMSIWVSNL